LRPQFAVPDDRQVDARQVFESVQEGEVIFDGHQSADRTDQRAVTVYPKLSPEGSARTADGEKGREVKAHRHDVELRRTADAEIEQRVADLGTYRQQNVGPVGQPALDGHETALGSRGEVAVEHVAVESVDGAGAVWHERAGQASDRAGLGQVVRSSRRTAMSAAMSAWGRTGRVSGTRRTATAGSDISPSDDSGLPAASTVGKSSLRAFVNSRAWRAGPPILSLVTKRKTETLTIAPSEGTLRA